MRLKRCFLILPFIFLLDACATSEKTAEQRIIEPLIEANDASSESVSYVPKTADISSDSTQSDASPKFLLPHIGRASWYGAKHHGRKTASGEIFNKNNLTAAHRTLPFGTRVQVTNVKNGKSVVVKINDRGPFHRNLIIDLSHAAASAIGMIRSGIIGVEIKVVTD